jgi:S1-C subfamily serine protease/predicted esterase
VFGLLTTSVFSEPNEAYQKITHEVLKKISPSVVKIETQGGTDIVKVGPKGAAFRKALGPTTGVIVSGDGYIISSAFNFINNPSSIFVEVQGDKNSPYKAEKVATDKSRMLTLLKIKGQNLPVPEFVAKKDIKVGQTTLALGRTLDSSHDGPPSVSFGIVSALGRIWGKCIQTDSKTSPVNYGGPIVDIQGRIQGIIIPASPKGEDETAGFEWYDSGIGFAVPMEDVLAVLPKLKKGQDLKPGQLGVKFESQDTFAGNLVIAEVVKETAAAKAGLEKGDKITEIDGKKVATIAQAKHVLGTKYEGDTIALKYERGGKEIAAQLELVGKAKVYATAYLGILPLRDDPKLGVEIRHVFPKSPADKAGLKAGDRIVKYGTANLEEFKGLIRGRNELMGFLSGPRPGDEIKLEVVRKGGKSDTLTVKLDEFPGSSADNRDVVPKDLPAKASVKKFLDPLDVPPGQPKPPAPGKKPEPDKGLIKLNAANGNHTYWVYVHNDYDPNIAHAALVWLHPPEKNTKNDMETFKDTWDKYCQEHNILLVFPISESEEGWTLNDATKVQEIVRDVLPRYSIDSQRIVAHGLGIGGQMAIHLGFVARDLFHGVATTGAVPTGISDNNPDQRVSFFLTSGDRDPLVKAIAASQDKMVEHKIPSVYIEMKDMGRQYLNAQTLEEMVRWLDALDRM